MTRLLSAAPLLAAFCAGACDGFSSRETVQSERTDSAGITVVRNFGPDRPLTWTFEPVMRLGGADEGPEAFYMLHEWTVDTDARGRIYVLDVPASRVAVFDSRGKHLRTLGRQGSGPGEMEEPMVLAVDADGTLLVADYARQLGLRWDSAGRVLDAIDSLRPGVLMHKPLEMVNGELFTVIEAPGSGGDSVAWHLVSSTGGIDEALATVARPRARGMSIGCAFGLFAPLFERDLVWDVGAARIAVAMEDVYGLDVVEDRQRMRVHRDLPSREVSEAMALAEAGSGMVALGAMRMECTTPPAVRVRNQGYSPRLPAIADVEVEPGGTLWVRRGSVHAEPRMIDVFDAEGSYLGTLPPDSPFPVAFLPDGALLAIERDEMDIDRLVIYRVHRGEA